MSSSYPLLVDFVNSTISGLLQNSLLVDNLRMIDSTPYEAIGLRLKSIREAYDPQLSQRAWAEKSGFSPTQYNNWENGIRRIPVESAEKLCDAYGLTLDFIYRGRRDGLSENARKAV